MKNIYNITKGQLLSAWVFGGIAWLYILDRGDDKFRIFLILFVLVFYTIGWRTARRSKTKPDA